MAEHQLALFETEVLLEQARKYGVDEPTDPACWADDRESGFSRGSNLLVDAERSGKVKSKNP
jgi:hypothetical protein